MSEATDDRTLTIVIHLPQPLDLVSDVLAAVVRSWPHATVDVSGAWRIDIPGDTP